MKKSLVSLISWLLVIAMMASMPLAAFADEPLPMKATINSDEGKITVSGDVVTVKASAFTAKTDGTGFEYTIGISGAGAAADVGTWIMANGDKFVVTVTSQKIREAVGDVIATKTYDFDGDETVDQTITVKIDSADKKLPVLEAPHVHDLVSFAAVPATDTTDGKTAGEYCKICGYDVPQTVVKSYGTLQSSTAVSGTLKNDATVVKQFSTGEFLCTLTKGYAVNVLKQWSYDGKVWGQIEVSGVGTGFINMADFTTSSESSSGSSGSTAKKTGVIANADSVNVRDYPNAGSTKVGTLKRGEEVTIYEQVTKGTKDWAKISAKEDKWVCMDYIQVSSGSTESSGSGETAADEKAIATGIVSSRINLNVRSAPGTTKPLVKSLPTGTQVSVFEVKSVNGADWGRIGKDQWVCMSYVQIQTGSIDSGSSSTSGTANATIVNCSTGVNVRSSASISGALAGRIAVNTRVYISEVKTASNGSKWGKTDKGWVCMDYVKLDSTSEVGDSGSVESSVSTTTGAPYANVTVPAKVNAGGASVYLNADTNSKLLVVLGAGQSIKISGRALVKDVQWGKVTIGSYTGWVEMKNIALEKVSGTVATAQLSVYDECSLSSKVNVIWGKGQAVTITQQYTDGTYLWGLTSSGWVNMASVTIVNSGTGTSAPTVSISASVKGNTLDIKDDKGKTVISLVKGTKITITDLKEDTGKYLGKVTVDSFSGWVDLSGVTQESIQGTVASESAALFTKPEDTAAAKSTKTLKKGTSVTILERVKAGGTLWGKLIVDKVYLWVKMDQVTTASVPTTPTNPAGSTGTGTGTGSGNGAVTTPTTGAAGTVVNTDSLNVRSAAGARNNKVTTLKRGTAVTVYEQKTVDGALWGRIDQGWVAMGYIDLSSKSTGTTSGVTGGIATGGTTIMTTVPSGAVAVGYVNYVNEVNIRSGAGQGYAKAGTLKKGANVVIYEQKLVDGMIWGRIDQGWICTSYVTMTGASVTGAGTAGTIARCFFTANVRSTPGVGNALVGKIMVNSRVEILETRTYSGEQWGRTSIGWINMNYVLLDGASAM
ncbi:MAG: SH3 domain-containing protein [Clostridiales bacterium]|nr:SH3 domain-containing protein [Clostridiales bacterium]